MVFVLYLAMKLSAAFVDVGSDIVGARVQREDETCKKLYVRFVAVCQTTRRIAVVKTYRVDSMYVVSI